jgi:hypothetical protein
MNLVDKILLESGGAEYSTPDFLKQHLQKKYGVKKMLPCGCDGLLWVAKNNHVIKVTVSEGEARLAKKMMGQDNPHYANVYSVHKFVVEGGDYHQQPLYIIEKEYILPLTQKERDEINFAWDRIRDNNKPGRPYEQTIERTKEMHPAHADVIDKIYRLVQFCKKHNLSDTGIKNFGKKANGELAGFDFQIHTNGELRGIPRFQAPGLQREIPFSKYTYANK